MFKKVTFFVLAIFTPGIILTAIAQSAQVKTADSLFLAGDYAHAKIAYKNLVNDTSKNGIWWNRMAFSYYNTGDYETALTAYHKALDESGFHQIGLGFQGVYVSKRLDVNSLKFEDMLRSDGFTGLTQEDFTNYHLDLSYFDLNAGFFYNGTTDGSNNFYLGGSMYHINKHEETFTDTGHYYMASRLTLQAGGMVPLGEYNAFHFSAMHSRQANAVNTVIGGAYMLNINPDEWSPTNLYLGTWFRFGDAVIPYVGLEFGEFRVGASYDVNVSSLKPASNMRGGAEFSLIYVKRPVDPNAKKLNCPKF